MAEVDQNRKHSDIIKMPLLFDEYDLIKRIYLRPRKSPDYIFSFCHPLQCPIKAVSVSHKFSCTTEF